MRRCVDLAVVAILAAVAAGCLGSASQHGTLSASDALAQAREDGFVEPTRQPNPSAWWCDRTRARSGGPGWPNYVTPNYAILFEDKRVPDGHDNSARIIMMAIVFPNARIARRCAEGGIYQDKHLPVEGYDAEGDGPFKRYKQIDPTTVETAMHAPGGPGSANDVDDGSYETWIAHGRVFAIGLAYNEPHSQIVREDLERLAAEIDG